MLFEYIYLDDSPLNPYTSTCMCIAYGSNSVGVVLTTSWQTQSGEHLLLSGLSCVLKDANSLIIS